MTEYKKIGSDVYFASKIDVAQKIKDIDGEIANLHAAIAILQAEKDSLNSIK